MAIRFYGNKAEESNQIIEISDFWIDKLEMKVKNADEMYSIDLKLIASVVRVSEYKFVHTKSGKTAGVPGRGPRPALGGRRRAEAVGRGATGRTFGFPAT